MKRFIYYMMGSLAAAALLASCAKQEEQVERKEIKFSASVGNFQVKATDTAFEQGDEISLSAEWPINVSNVKLTWDGNALVPETSIYWGEGQDATHAANFLAFSPYIIFNENEALFAVQTDQTTEAAFKASDLMSAYATMAPKDGNTVHLNFLHRLSKVVLTIDNQLRKEIVDVTVGGLHLDYKCWIYDSAEYWQALYDDRYSDNIGSIKAAKVHLPDGSPAWAFITIPQWAEPVFKVTTADGEEYTYQVSELVYFESGRRYNATLVANDNGADMNFQAEVLDWMAGEDLYFNGDPGMQEHQWSVVCNDVWYPMTQLEDGRFYLRYDGFMNGRNFNIVRNEWEVNLGCAIPEYEPYLNEGDELNIPLSAFGSIKLYTAAGMIVDLWFDESNKTLKVIPVAHEWEYMGEGIFVEDIFASWMGYPHMELTVDVMKDAYYPGWYKMVDPYASWPYRNDEAFAGYESQDILICVKEDNTCWIPDGTQLSPISNNYGRMYINLRVPENGWNNWQYGDFNPDEGFIRFYNNMSCSSEHRESFYANYSGMFSLTLPGYERPKCFVSVSLTNNGYRYYEGGTFASFRIRAGLDTQTLKYLVFPGTLGQAECETLWQEVKDGGIQITGFVPENLYALSIPIEHTGTYTIIAYADNGEGYYAWRYFNFPVVVEGDDAPDPQLSMKAGQDTTFPDHEVVAYVQFADPSELYLMVMEKAAFEDAGLQEDQIFDYVRNNGAWFGSGDMEGGELVHSYSGLQSGTTYYLMAAGTTLFDRNTSAIVEFTTADEPEFEAYGTGIYQDHFLFWYSTEAEVWRAKDIPSRYRLLNPFKAYWDEHSTDEDYAGYSADYIDFVIDDEHIYYLPFQTGLVNTGRGTIRYEMKSFGGAMTPNNIRIQEGVYGLGPYGLIGNWGYYQYPDPTRVIIVMPGYSYDRSTASAVAPLRKSAIPFVELEK